MGVPHRTSLPIAKPVQSGQSIAKPAPCIREHCESTDQQGRIWSVLTLCWGGQQGRSPPPQAFQIFSIKLFKKIYIYIFFKQISFHNA